MDVANEQQGFPADSLPGPIFPAGVSRRIVDHALGRKLAAALIAADVAAITLGFALGTRPQKKVDASRPGSIRDLPREAAAVLCISRGHFPGRRCSRRRSVPVGLFVGRDLEGEGLALL